MLSAGRPQLESLRDGLLDSVTGLRECLSPLSPMELRLLLGGEPHVDVRKLLSCIKYPEPPGNMRELLEEVLRGWDTPLLRININKFLLYITEQEMLPFAPPQNYIKVQ